MPEQPPKADPRRETRTLLPDGRVSCKFTDPYGLRWTMNLTPTFLEYLDGLAAAYPKTAAEDVSRG